MPRKFSPERNDGSKKPLTQPQIDQIKRLLNIPRRAPLPKCPSKNNSEVRRLAVKGEPWHKDKKHAPCHQCSCRNTAGLGTSHYGFGWCYLHEIGASVKMCDTMAEADLRAHQQRHPRVFDDGVQYLQELQKESEKLNSKFDLTCEMDNARALVNDMYQRVSDFEKDQNKTAAEIEDIITKLSNTIEWATVLTEDEKKSLQNTLENIEKRLICPLTEKGKDGPVEMSFATRARLQMDSSEALTRIGERVQKLKAINMITREAFVVWLGLFHQNLKKEFGTLTYTRPDGTKMIIEGIGESMRVTGEPRRGI